jgi:hypothetical protein
MNQSQGEVSVVKMNYERFTTVEFQSRKIAIILLGGFFDCRRIIMIRRAKIYRNYRRRRIGNT